MLPPQMPNRYDSDEERMKRLEERDGGRRGQSMLLLVIGCLLLLAYLPLRLVGWPGVTLILAPIGLGMILVAGIQLFAERAAP